MRDIDEIQPAASTMNILRIRQHDHRR